jgi:hypothetical protein
LKRDDLANVSAVHERYGKSWANRVRPTFFGVSGFLPQQLVVTNAAASSKRRIV